MLIRFSILVLLLSLFLAGCRSSKVDVAEAEKKVAEAQQQLEEAKKAAGAEQRVAELEKQLEAARKEAAAAKTEVPATKPEAPAAAPATPPPPPKPKVFTLAAGTALPIRTTTAMSTKTAKAGATFEASLTAPLTVDGEVLAPAGAAVTGVVVDSDDGGRVKGKATISIALKTIATKYGPVAVQTDSKQAVAQSTVKKDVVRGGIMTGAGAAIGAIAGGGKGAAIGAGIGGAAGVGTAMATKGAAATFPAETPLSFTLKAPVTVTEKP
jgi:sRNA-binding protein